MKLYIISDCGGRLTGETGSFSYPTEIGANYPHGVSCAWRIASTSGKASFEICKKKKKKLGEIQI